MALAGELAGGGAHPQHLDLVADLIAGNDRTPEARPLDRHEVEELAVAVGDVVEQQDPAGLRHAFHHQHAGHHRLAGKVADEEALVDGDVLDRDDAAPRLDLEHAIDQQHRVAVRQHRLDPAHVPGPDRRHRVTLHPAPARTALRVAAPARRRPSLRPLDRRQPPADLGQALQQGHLPAPSRRFDRRRARHLLTLRHVVEHRRLAADARPVTDGDAVRDSRLPGEDDAVADGRAARDAGLAAQDTRPSDAHVVTDLHQVVDLGARSDARLVERRAVDRRVGADLDVVLEHGDADLRHLEVAPAARDVAEAVGADHRAGVEHHPLPHHRCPDRGRREDGGRRRRRPAQPAPTQTNGWSTARSPIVGALAHHHVGADRRARRDARARRRPPRSAWTPAAGAGSG